MSNQLGIPEIIMGSFVVDDFDVSAEPLEEGTGGNMCDSCYYNYEEKDFFALSCGHKFCINCNRDHL